MSESSDAGERRFGGQGTGFKSPNASRLLAVRWCLIQLFSFQKMTVTSLPRARVSDIAHQEHSLLNPD